MKSALNDPRVGIRDVFAGAFPVVLTMFVVLLRLLAFPGLSTWLARM